MVKKGGVSAQDKDRVRVEQLISPRRNTPDQVLVILGIKASLFHRLAALCGHSKGEALARALYVSSFGPKKEFS